MLRRNLLTLGLALPLLAVPGVTLAQAAPTAPGRQAQLATDMDVALDTRPTTVAPIPGRAGPYLAARLFGLRAYAEIYGSAMPVARNRSSSEIEASTIQPSSACTTP